MQRLLRTWPLVILFSSATHAEPIRLIHDGIDYLIIELSTTAIKTRAVALGTDAFVELSAKDFTNMGEAGGAALPVASRLIAIPPNTRPIATVISKEEQPLPLKTKLAFYSGMRRHCSAGYRKIHFDPAPYIAAKTPPTLKISASSFIGPAQTAVLSYAPVHYNPENLKATVTTKMIVRVDFVKNRNRTPNPPVNPKNLVDKDFYLYRSLFLNKSLFANFGRDQRKNATVLIITPSMYVQALQPLIRFKESLGIKAIIKTLEQPTTATVKNLISNEYRQTPPSHTLLVGSIGQLPSFRHKDFWTDYDYSLLDTGIFPDISLGRLPVRNVAELQEVIYKIIAREKFPQNERSILAASGFETEWCQENIDFILNQIFENSRFSVQTDKLYASESQRTNAMIAALNANPNIVIYDGHGDRRGMNEIPLFLSHLDKLTNRAYPVIFDMACENASWPESGGGNSPNFSESILKLKNAGAAGVVAASHLANGHDLFRHFFRSAVFDESDSREPYHEISEMGAIVLWGKLKYLEQYAGNDDAQLDNYMFYYLGDPQTTVFPVRN